MYVFVVDFVFVGTLRRQWAWIAGFVDRVCIVELIGRVQYTVTHTYTSIYQ